MTTVRKATKILKASDIMKKKGIVQKQMDMSKFNEVVEDFFMTHEPKETILPHAHVEIVDEVTFWRVVHLDKSFRSERVGEEMR